MRWFAIPVPLYGYPVVALEGRVNAADQRTE